MKKEDPYRLQWWKWWKTGKEGEKHVKLKTDTTDVLLLHLYIKSKS